MYCSYNIYTLNWNFRWEKYTFEIVYLYPVHLHHLQHSGFEVIFPVLCYDAADWTANCSEAYAEYLLRLELTPKTMHQIVYNVHKFHTHIHTHFVWINKQKFLAI